MTTAKLYKHQTTLICSGLAVIAFGLWSIVRVSLLFYLQRSRILQLIMEGELELLTGQSTDTITAILFGVAIGFLILDLLFRLYIGLSAIREGNGKRRRLAYVVLAIVYLVFLLGGLIGNHAEVWKTAVFSCVGMLMFMAVCVLSCSVLIRKKIQQITKKSIIDNIREL